MSGQAFIVLGVALVVIALERMLSATLVVSAGTDEVSIRLLTGFVCGGLAPVVVVIGYLKTRRTPAKSKPAADD